MNGKYGQIIFCFWSSGNGPIIHEEYQDNVWEDGDGAFKFCQECDQIEMKEISKVARDI